LLTPALCAASNTANTTNDLQQIKERGVLRHLGITYAHFVMKKQGNVTGLDVEMMQLFAKYLGVKYQFVDTTWETIFTDLTGRKLNQRTNEYFPESTEEIKGDLIANGLTILPWRLQIVDYSLPTFPTGVWLIGPTKTTLSPIKPSGDISLDVDNVIQLLKGHSVLTVKHTCLDASTYNFSSPEIKIINFTKNNSLDELVPSILQGEAETTLLDIPDALIALQKYPGEIIILGPVTAPQLMGVAVPKTSPNLRKEFNKFFEQIWQDGTYLKLVTKYYPSVFLYFEEFFHQKTNIQ
jgi:ABC-type amino acid transport substrate-binding protein